MGKKKFFDKKKSATFQLLSRDSSDPIYVEEPENDRVFVRVDNNRVKINGLDEDNDDEDYSNDPESIYADAPEDGGYQGFRSSGTLPDHVRREILELGFPDDGYNYLNHLREIRNTGGGSAYYENPKAELHQLPNDVKAYDASRVRIKEASEITSPKTLYNVAEKTVTVKVQKAVDPEIANLLEDNESEFGSDIDELEEDFVVLANHSEEIGDVYEEESLSSISNPHAEVQTGVAYNSTAEVVRSVNEDNRPQRLLDQQFDILEQQEYGSDSDDDYKNYVAEEEDISLAEKLNSVLKDRVVDDLEFDGNYTAPAEILRRCAEYAEKYENEDGNDKEVVIVEESSDESEIWDCETIVSTYSNLDNHPGRIGVPGRNRKKILAETFSGALKSGSDKIITLGGKAKLPVDYLPHGKKEPKETAKVVAKPEVPKRKPHGQETKEEKKERKAAVKEEKREARRLKKDLKELYRDEAKLAQKVAAVTGPSSIHLM
ncbi:protein LTV1 homolog [Chenopodium quinoa]|uniref:Low temperature viability protein n=1 Tax=Chenopodium quinoa TaxID=63459 RepID=A0A803N8N8_CHEQI|nr:protein LTV1 homolog [Chenopodium quinoa]XP_021754952.1 protein LTV1 homolog [Chenopodium quinoa]XP_021754953.1 protein LTV1 homolog [Chenopodium quinoa]